MMTIEEYIEEQGYTNIAEDTFECPGGHVWHIDDIKALWKEECYWIDEKL